MISPGAALIGIDDWPHLFCVLATDEDAGIAVLVNLTAHKPQIHTHRACTVVRPGEHEWIRAACCLYFHGSTLARLDDLAHRAATGRYLRLKPLRHALLSRIQQAAITSPLTPSEVANLIQASEVRPRSPRRITDAQGVLDHHLHQR